MQPESLNWESVDWKKVYRRSYRPVKLRGNSNSYIATRFVGLLLILFFAFVSGIEINWGWDLILFTLAAFLWVGWSLWPILENQLACRYVLKACIEFKQEVRFGEREKCSRKIVIQKAFRITREGKLIKASGWIGRCRVRFPTWLNHYVETQEELDLLCLSTHKILGKLEEFTRHQYVK